MKCDLIGHHGGQDAPHDMEEILSNKGGFAAHPHGWYAVVNNGAKTDVERDFFSRLRHDREYEEEFFDATQPYNYEHLRNRCGVENLVGMLSG